MFESMENSTNLQLPPSSAGPGNEKDQTMTAAVENHFKYLTRFIPLPPFTFHSADDDQCPASKNSN